MILATLWPRPSIVSWTSSNHRSIMSLSTLNTAFYTSNPQITSRIQIQYINIQWLLNPYGHFFFSHHFCQVSKLPNRCFFQKRISTNQSPTAQNVRYFQRCQPVVLQVDLEILVVIDALKQRPGVRGFQLLQSFNETFPSVRLDEQFVYKKWHVVEIVWLKYWQLYVHMFAVFFFYWVQKKWWELHPKRIEPATGKSPPLRSLVRSLTPRHEQRHRHWEIKKSAQVQVFRKARALRHHRSVSQYPQVMFSQLSRRCYRKITSLQGMVHIHTWSILIMWSVNGLDWV